MMGRPDMRWLRRLAILLLVVVGVSLAPGWIKGRLWQSRFDAGQKALAEGRFADARLELGRAAQIAGSFGGRDPRPARSLIAIGYVDVAQAKDDEAEGRFREALDWLEKQGLSETLDAAEALNGLSVVAGHRVRDADARASLERALAIQRGVLGTEHPIVARALNNLAWLASNEVRNAEAERLARQALAIREKTLDPGSVDVARNLSDLGWFLLRQSKYNQASSMLQPAQAILEPQGDSASLDLARCLNAQAS